MRGNLIISEETIKQLEQYKEPLPINGLNLITTFTVNDKEIEKAKADIKQKININTEYVKGLWAIFGKRNEANTLIKNWTCLEVGSSDNIGKELRGILTLMQSESAVNNKNSAFYKNIYSFDTYMDKTSVKYRSMKDICTDFMIYEVNIKEFLQGIDIKDYNPVNYAEVLLACKTKALFWNPAPQMRGNQEQIIYNELKPE